MVLRANRRHAVRVVSTECVLEIGLITILKEEFKRRPESVNTVPIPSPGGATQAARLYISFSMPLVAY